MPRPPMAAIAKAKLEESEPRGHTRTARSRKRSDDQLTEPSLPPPDPRSPIDLSSGLPLSVADAAVPAVKPKRRWASQVLTAAMLVCFTACGWCWSQVGRWLWTHNPFYFISALLIRCGTDTANRTLGRSTVG
ncbi:MAG: hypothetical protein NTZ32_04355 [Planctomycetales bacterium]|nr:hypothetical protein [Planctomycetales bacterium]